MMAIANILLKVKSNFCEVDSSNGMGSFVYILHIGKGLCLEKIYESSLELSNVFPKNVSGLNFISHCFIVNFTHNISTMRYKADNVTQIFYPSQKILC